MDGFRISCLAVILALAAAVTGCASGEDMLASILCGMAHHPCGVPKPEGPPDMTSLPPPP